MCLSMHQLNISLASYYIINMGKWRRWAWVIWARKIGIYNEIFILAMMCCTLYQNEKKLYSYLALAIQNVKFDYFLIDYMTLHSWLSYLFIFYSKFIIFMHRLKCSLYFVCLTSNETEFSFNTINCNNIIQKCIYIYYRCNDLIIMI